MILSAQPDMEVVGEATNGEEAIGSWRQLRPDLILMDVRMPKLDGLEASRRILKDGGDGTRVVILTTFDLDEYVYAALRAGASGFLLKDLTPEQLVSSIRIVLNGDALLAPSITRRLVERFARPDTTSRGTADLSTLTARELEVLRLMARGLSNAEIAERLFLSETTIKTHVARILPKLDLRDRVQAVVFAYESGLIAPGD
ncbi:MAG: response regulator transcription factor [Chloroflexi bacterium]|nr:MAG: response regulator transcription factor [Chloroflexota bacterium]